MVRMVKCAKLHRELPGIPYKPFRGSLGERIYAEISQEAWRQWIEHSKMIVNESQLNLTTQRAHDILKEQCEAFFFGEGSAPPAEYKPPE